MHSSTNGSSFHHTHRPGGEVPGLAEVLPDYLQSHVDAGSSPLMPPYYVPPPEAGRQSTDYSTAMIDEKRVSRNAVPVAPSRLDKASCDDGAIPYLSNRRRKRKALLPLSVNECLDIVGRSMQKRNRKSDGTVLTRQTRERNPLFFLDDSYPAVREGPSPVSSRQTADPHMPLKKPQYQSMDAWKQDDDLSVDPTSHSHGGGLCDPVMALSGYPVMRHQEKESIRQKILHNYTGPRPLGFQKAPTVVVIREVVHKREYSSDREDEDMDATLGDLQGHPGDLDEQGMSYSPLQRKTKNSKSTAACLPHGNEPPVLRSTRKKDHRSPNLASAGCPVSGIDGPEAEERVTPPQEHTALQIKKDENGTNTALQEESDPELEVEEGKDEELCEGTVMDSAVLRAPVTRAIMGASAGEFTSLGSSIVATGKANRSTEEQRLKDFTSSTVFDSMTRMEALVHSTGTPSGPGGLGSDQDTHDENEAKERDAESVRRTDGDSGIGSAAQLSHARPETACFPNGNLQDRSGEEKNMVKVADEEEGGAEMHNLCEGCQRLRTSSPSALITSPKRGETAAVAAAEHPPAVAATRSPGSPPGCEGEPRRAAMEEASERANQKRSRKEKKKDVKPRAKENGAIANRGDSRSRRQRVLVLGTPSPRLAKEDGDAWIASGGLTLAESNQLRREAADLARRLKEKERDNQRRFQRLEETINARVAEASEQLRALYESRRQELVRTLSNTRDELAETSQRLEIAMTRTEHRVQAALDLQDALTKAEKEKVELFWRERLRLAELQEECRQEQRRIEQESWLQDLEERNGTIETLRQSLQKVAAEHQELSLTCRKQVQEIRLLRFEKANREAQTKSNHLSSSAPWSAALIRGGTAAATAGLPKTIARTVQETQEETEETYTVEELLRIMAEMGNHQAALLSRLDEKDAEMSEHEAQHKKHVKELQHDLQRERARSGDLVMLYSEQVQSLHSQLAECEAEKKEYKEKLALLRSQIR